MKDHLSHDCYSPIILLVYFHKITICYLIRIDFSLCEKWSFIKIYHYQLLLGHLCKFKSNAAIKKADKLMYEGKKSKYSVVVKKTSEVD